MKVKIFEKAGNFPAEDIEDNVNKWLSNNKNIVITNITHAMCGYGSSSNIQVQISIFYTDKEEEQSASHE